MSPPAASSARSSCPNATAAATAKAGGSPGGPPGPSTRCRCSDRRWHRCRPGRAGPRDPHGGIRPALRRTPAADERFAGSARRPVIKPHTVVIDHGSPYISEDFTRACLSLGIQVRKARLRTAIDKAIVERAMRAIKFGFSQYLASYTHHRLDLRGKKVRKQLVWTIPQLQDLFEQWVVLHWQQMPHGGLRSPFHPGVKVSPNAMYAALGMRGYRRISLTESQTRKLLPAWYVRVTRKGFQLNNRTYNLERGAWTPSAAVRSGLAQGPLGGALLPQQPRIRLVVRPSGRGARGGPVGGGSLHPPPAAARPVDGGSLGGSRTHPPGPGRQHPGRGGYHAGPGRAAAHHGRRAAGAAARPHHPRGRAGPAGPAAPRALASSVEATAELPPLDIESAAPVPLAGPARARSVRHPGTGTGRRPEP
ncbi:transposase [Streptomyces griseoviridis]|uniref:Transposase n=1 Tax=Streptomyces griseoviridis TaxID=45398 RepID=A0A3S9Z523_STRGD|nr:transposase [Streptomyces griseoviridis]